MAAATSSQGCWIISNTKGRDAGWTESFPAVNAALVELVWRRQELRKSFLISATGCQCPAAGPGAHHWDWHTSSQNSLLQGRKGHCCCSTAGSRSSSTRAEGFSGVFWGFLQLWVDFDAVLWAVFQCTGRAGLDEGICAVPAGSNRAFLQKS